MPTVRDVPAHCREDRVRPETSETDDSWGQLVTVVIPCRNEEASIEHCVASIQAQTYRNLQIVVVDGASEDSTVNILQGMARADPRIEVIDNPERIIPRALNLALESARGDWLVRVDAHATVPADYVERSVRHLQSDVNYGGVGGRKDGVGVTASGRAIAVAMSSKFGVGNSVYHHGDRMQFVDHIPFGCYPTAVARELDGWDVGLAVNQDFEFDYRVRQLGRQLLFDPDLRIDWECRQSIRDLARQYWRYGRGKVRVLRKHPESIRLRQTVPPVFMALLAISAVRSRRHPVSGVVLLVAYAGFVTIGSVRELHRLDRSARLRLPAALVTMHVAWGCGFWHGIVREIRRTVSHPKP